MGTIAMTWRPSSVVWKLFTFQASSPKPHAGPIAIPSYYVFLNGTAFNCIYIKFEKQNNI
jgi:hypothetical protein